MLALLIHREISLYVLMNSRYVKESFWILPVLVKEADGDPDDEQGHGAQLAHLERPRDVRQVVCAGGNERTDCNIAGQKGQTTEH